VLRDTGAECDRELEIKHGKVDEALQTSARRGAISTQRH